MVDSSITKEDVAGRARVAKLVLTEPREALKIARAIRHPWYRCQSLSMVAEHWGNAVQRKHVLAEALRSAEEQTQINRIVTVASWPLRVMASVDRDAVPQHLGRFVELANREPHSLRRADSLFALANSVSGSSELWVLVIPSLVDALSLSYGWKTDRLIAWSIPMVRTVMPEALGPLVARHRPGNKKQRLEESLATMFDTR
ncbi:hypothetical protein [Luteibacter rhizovicinus]|uniref:hypothetical protein n=1 Tax=Luteibacter rhizovicinus TaxID=242606 RepID=UPI00069BF980|nr:hypothetical protein [Luteibacter rhizovicinus]